MKSLSMLSLGIWTFTTFAIVVAINVTGTGIPLLAYVFPVIGTALLTVISENEKLKREWMEDEKDD